MLTDTNMVYLRQEGSWRCPGGPRTWYTSRKIPPVKANTEKVHWYHWVHKAGYWPDPMEAFTQLVGTRRFRRSLRIPCPQDLKESCILLPNINKENDIKKFISWENGDFGLQKGALTVQLGTGVYSQRRGSVDWDRRALRTPSSQPCVSILMVYDCISGGECVRV